MLDALVRVGEEPVLRVRRQMAEVVSLPEHRSQLQARMRKLRDLMKAA
ncbi:MAG: hypothetical protein AAFW84_20080 [Cyanobacteria bacterium J06635_15]